MDRNIEHEEKGGHTFRVAKNTFNLVIPSSIIAKLSQAAKTVHTFYISAKTRLYILKTHTILKFMQSTIQIFIPTIQPVSAYLCIVTYGFTGYVL